MMQSSLTIGSLQEGRLNELEKGKRRAFLIGVYKSSKEKTLCSEYLEELESLCYTYGLKTITKYPCSLPYIDSATFLGKGKLDELLTLFTEKEIDIVIFDEELSPHQQRNLEKIFQRIVIDRTELILGVFAQRARTKEAKIQISIAQLKYQLPRLKRLWTHLERQRTGGGTGGGGYLKGAGEKQLEIDKRIVKKQIAKMQEELEDVKKHRENQRKQRKRRSIPTFAIIGYTNVGKSTLLNALTKADVLVEDKLFATLDTTTRRFVLPNKQEILLIDTVGFIRKIPHTLVASFKSTLEESLQADILLHLIDVSSEMAEQQAATTYEVLKELGGATFPVITCFNKIDVCQDKKVLNRLKLKYPKHVEISALEQRGFDKLLASMMREISLLRKTYKLRIPQSHYALVSELMHEGRVIACDYEENYILLTMELPSILENKIVPFIA